jgi:hypothetical protein
MESRTHPKSGKRAPTEDAALQTAKEIKVTVVKIASRQE